MWQNYVGGNVCFYICKHPVALGGVDWTGFGGMIVKVEDATLILLEKAIPYLLGLK